MKNAFPWPLNTPRNAGAEERARGGEMTNLPGTGERGHKVRALHRHLSPSRNQQGGREGEDEKKKKDRKTEGAGQSFNMH